MRYDFDKIIDRRRSCSLKWTVAENELPMWVADMDFETAPEIRAAFRARVEHAVFGYAIVPDAWSEAYVQWWKKRHGVTFQKEWFIFCAGVVPAISSMVRKLTTPAENVVLMTPVYNIFFHSVLNNGRRVLESPLRYDGKGYTVDFDDLEQKLSDPQTSLMILCNPHNPIGKIWDREVLERIGMLCKKHHVTVISDEIHGDLTAPGKEYVPFSSVSDVCRDISITCLAPTKAFNLAGIQTAAVVVADEVLRHRVWRGLNTDEVAEPNAFAVDAAVAAFTRGGPWLESLREYLQKNKELAASFLRSRIPQLRVVPSDATYLMWLFCGDLGDATAVANFIRSETGLFLSAGNAYGGNGAQFLRLNVACPRTVLQEGLERLRTGVEKFKGRKKGK